METKLFTRLIMITPQKAGQNPSICKFGMKLTARSSIATFIIM